MNEFLDANIIHSYPINENEIKALSLRPIKIPTIACRCLKCGAQGSGPMPMEVEDDFFLPLNPSVGGITLGMAGHHKDNSHEQDSEHFMFFIAGAIDNRVFQATINVHGGTIGALRNLKYLK